MNNNMLLAVSVIMSLLYGILRSIFCKKDVKSDTDLQAFNAASSFVSAITLAVIAFMSDTFSLPSAYTVILGIAYGVVTALCSILNLKALECGPLSYTSVIISCAMVIPALSGLVLYGEAVSVSQWIGIALMLVSFICAVDKGNGKSGTSIKWMLLCLGAFLFSGSVGVMQKIHQSSDFAGELSAFLVIAFLVATVFSLGLSAYYSKSKGQKITVFKRDAIVRFMIFILVTGIGFALCNQINMYLSGVMDSIIFFPVVNGAGMLLTSAAGLIMWKERFSRKQWVGMATGAVAIFLLCNLF